jgi:uroporphyrinogen decarboxylase
MTDRLNHTERLQALVEGIQPDRPPVSMWRHFYNEENDPDQFAEAMIGWQKKYDWDFLKINPKASFHYEPWGVKMTFSPDCVIKPVRTEFPIKTIADWANVSVLPVSHPEVDKQVRSIAKIRKALPKPFRIVMTLFSPISVAGDMVPSDDILIGHLHESPEAVEQALAAIQTTFLNLVPEMRNAGADGLFFATTQWASADRLTVPELQRFGLKYDRPIWDAAGDDSFNVLHVCDTKNYLKQYSDFQADLTNWDTSDPANPTLGDGFEMLHRPVMGGIAHNTDLLNDSPAILRDKARRLIDSHRKLPFAVGPGCAIPVSVPDANIAAVRDAVAESAT